MTLRSGAPSITNIGQPCIDARGHIRHHQFGEGEYDQSETVIQELLIDTGAQGIGHDSANVEGVGIEAAPDWTDLRSPESYVVMIAPRTSRLPAAKSGKSATSMFAPRH